MGGGARGGGVEIPTPNVEFSRRGRKVERKGKVQKRSIIREMIKRRRPTLFLGIYISQAIIRYFHTYHINHIINLFIRVLFSPPLSIYAGT